MSIPAAAWLTDCLHQHLQSFVIGDIAIADQPVMAMIGIGIERCIADQRDLREFGF